MRRSAGHAVQLFGLHQNLFQACGHLGCASCCLWHDEGCAFSGQIVGVTRLMVINRVGQRYQQRRQTGGGQFADGQCACAADHQIGPAIGLGHVLDERRNLRLDARVAIALGGNGVMILARLVKHFGQDVWGN